MSVDFSALESLWNKTPTAAQKPATEQNTAYDRHTGKPQTVNLSRLMEIGGEQPAGIKNPYQENIRRAETLMEKIQKAVREGEPPTALFLQAAECISLMTGDQVFYNQIKGDVLTVWGDAIQEESALRMRAQETRERLERINAAMKAEDLTGAEKERLQKAAAAHEKKIQELERIIQEQERAKA